MSKEQKSNREDKKKPAMSPKEKRLRRNPRKILRVNKENITFRQQFTSNVFPVLAGLKDCGKISEKFDAE